MISRMGVMGVMVADIERRGGGWRWMTSALFIAISGYQFSAAMYERAEYDRFVG